MYFRLFLLLIAAIPFTACGNAPSPAKGQPASVPSIHTPVDARPAEVTPVAIQTEGNQPGTTLPAAQPVRQVETGKNISPSFSTKKEKPAAPAVTTAPTAEAKSEPSPQTPVVEKTPPSEPTIPQNQPVNLPVETPAVPQPPSHEAWDKLLQQYVSDAGKVNYAGFKKDKAKLEAYLTILQKNPPQNDWSRADKMAFWINAYNAFTVKLIVDNYPISSIMKLDGGKPWDVKRIDIGGKNYSLNNIENDILRPQFKDARIHFAVNCAAKSCPPLLNRAWTAANLESNFEKQAKAFINNTNFNKISAKEVEVSKIFEWYAADFGNLIEFLNKYATTKIDAGAKVKYREYDWALNE